MSNLWLKKPGNVSQSDLRRLEEEKAARATPDIKSTPDIITTPEIKPPVDTREPEPKTPPTVEVKPGPDIKFTPDIKSIVPSQWTAVPNDISDHLNATLELSDQALLARLYRLTWGFHKDTCNVSNVALGTACNMSSKQVQRSARRLEQRGIIKVMGYDFDNPEKKKRGVIYKMLLPKATVDIKSGADSKSRAVVKSGADTMSPIKEKAFKETNQKGPSRLTPEEIQSYASTVADLLGEGKTPEEVESRFAPNMHGADWAAVRSVAQASIKRS